MEEVPERRNEKDLPVLRVFLVPLMAHLKYDYITASTQGGNLSLQFWEQYVTLSEEQRRNFL